MKLDDEHKRILAELFEAFNTPLDRLPYTPEFDQMHNRFMMLTRIRIDRSELWRHLCGLRKSKKLVRTQRANENG